MAEPVETLPGEVRVPVAPSASLRALTQPDSPAAGRADALRAQILDLVGDYCRAAFPARPFLPGQSPVPVAGRVFDDREVRALVDSGLDFWLTAGRCADQFERDFARVFGSRFSLLVNSGSSANLVAVSCLTSPLAGERRLRPGDEVITVAAGFPTTVNPIVQNGLVPVFLDVTAPTYNVDVTQLDDALSGRTRAIVLAHALGNPFDLAVVSAFARRTTSGWWKTAATPSARPTGAGRSAPSAIWRRAVSTRPTTSRWARAAP